VTLPEIVLLAVTAVVAAWLRWASWARAREVEVQAEVMMWEQPPRFVHSTRPGRAIFGDVDPLHPAPPEKPWVNYGADFDMIPRNKGYWEPGYWEDMSSETR
jgi:hypothetical protein